MAILQRNAAGSLDDAGSLAAAEPWPVQRLPAGDYISLVTNPREFARMESSWKLLEAATGPAHRVFQSFGWLNGWASTYDAKLCVVTGHRGGDMVFALPLMRTRLGPLTALRWMSEPHSQYGDILLARHQCPASWLEAAMGFLRQLKGIDILRLRHVREDALIAPYLAARFRSSNLDDAAPWLDLAKFSSEEDYDQRYTASQRKRRKKIRKSLEDDFGPVTFELLNEGPQLEAALREAIAEKCQWIDARGRHNRVLGCPRLAEFLNHALNTRGGAARLVVSRLSAGGRPVSWELGLRYGTTHFCFITAHVNALNNYSPARLHMDLSQRQALRDGMAIFDLMVPNDGYKNSWCSARMATHDYHLALTPLGRLYGAGYLEQLRPRLRRAYYSMPPEVLRLLKPIIGH